MYECKIAEKLAELRISKGETQTDLAQKLSVSNKTVSKWENGTSMPDLPMLVELSKYYGITTDALLGLAEEDKKSTEEEVRPLFEGLGRNETVFKAFKILKSVIPATIYTFAGSEASHKDSVDSFFDDSSSTTRSKISAHDFFEFVANSDDVNVAVMLLRNKANFEWLREPDKQKMIVKFFKFLSSEEALSVLYFIHSEVCSETFTADYVAKNTGVKEERVSEILDEFCAVGHCRWLIANLAEGEVKVYESVGDGIILSVISLAFENMCGNRAYDYNITKSCKMIGGK